LKNKKVLILGAGGAASSAIYAIKDQVKSICIINRTKDRARQLAFRYNCNIADFDQLEKLVDESHIIISTIPNGSELISPAWINYDKILFDANYRNPQFDKYANNNYVKFISGSHWLINQAIPAFQIFFNRENIDDTDLINILIKEQIKTKGIALIGFMGSGKTSIGRKFAEQLKCEFIDLDELIQVKTNLTITEIFSKYGENYFRQLETDILNSLSVNKFTILACGGGIIENHRNIEYLQKHFYNIWLYRSIKNIKTLDSTNRPLLQKNLTHTEIEQLFLQRTYKYAKTADLLINTEQKSIQHLTHILTKELSFLLHN
jgi:shikimate kinase